MKLFDNYLKTADKNQKLMIGFSFFVVIGFLLNQFVPPKLEHQNNLIENINTLQLKLSKNTTKRLKRQFSKKTKELLLAKEQLDAKKAEVNFVMSNIFKIKYAFFDDKNWANTLDDILKYSIKRNLKIESLKSIDVKDDSKNILKSKKNIKIDGIGRYANIIALIQYIENFDTLLEFNKIDMSLTKKSVEFSFDISVYGVGL